MNNYFNLVIFCLLFDFARCIDFCDENSGSNLTFYNDLTIQNCGCTQHDCIRKCCKSGFYLSKKKICRRSYTNDTFNIPMYRRKTVFSKIVTNEYGFRVGVLECRYYRLRNDSKDTYFLQENGLLWMPNHGRGIFYENSEYCVDESNGLSVFICFDEANPMELVGANVNASGMIISMPFLLITFLVYAILPDRNLHQRALMFYVLALLVSYILLVTINLSGTLEKPWCEIFAYSTIFSFMVSFFWMNVICFDIWYTFSGGRGFVGSKRTSERRKLLLYSLYAFGVPILVIIIVFVMQQVLPEDSEHNPGIGVSKCFLTEGWPTLWYFYLETGILVIANVIFFLLTAFKIRQVKKETSMLKQNDSKRHTYEKDKQKFNLYVRLLFAMGVNWSMEVISWLVNWKTGGKVQYIWYATDFFNAVYGVFIFFIFVFKKKIWNLLQRRFNWKTSRETVITGTSPAASTSNVSNNNITLQ